MITAEERPKRTLAYILSTTTTDGEITMPEQAERIDLDATAALVKAATSGPWEFQYWGGQNQNGDCAESILFDGSGESLTYGLPDADGEFITHARTIVPALMDEVRSLRAALAKANAAAVAAYDGNALIQQANAHRDDALGTLREIADAVASGGDVSLTVRCILIREGLYEPPAADPVVEAFEAGDPGRALERATGTWRDDPEGTAAAMRVALAASLDAAFDGAPAAPSAVTSIVDSLTDPRDAQSIMRTIPKTFGARVYGRVLLFHQVAKTPLWGHAEALTSTGALREAGLATSDLGWPANVLHNFYAADAVEWEPQDRARFDAAVQAWRDAHPDGAL